MKKWGKPEEIIAQKVSKDQIPGILHKEIFLENDEIALVRRADSVMEELRAGKHNVKGGFTDIVFIDAKTKTLKRSVENLLTTDDNNVSCDIEIRFDVTVPEKLARNLLANKTALHIDDVYKEIYSELISRVLSPIVRRTDIAGLYGNRKVTDDISIAFEAELKKFLDIWGVELVALSIIWKFPENYSQYLKSRGLSKLASKEQEEAHAEQVKSALREREISRIRAAGPTEEDVKSRMRKESIEAEVKLGVRKMESAQDAAEALDALKLKEIMDKQKIARKAKKKELGIESEGE